ELLHTSEGVDVDLAHLPADDPATYAMIRRADTVGAFQIESRAQMQSLLQTRPENLHDLTIQVALIRPGPVSGGAVHPYVQHRRARRADPDFEPPYDHPLLEGCLRETLGVVVFQEQVLEVAMALAGFSAGQAEGLRRAMSRKRSREAMIALWRDFLEGAREQGVDDDTTKEIFTKLIGFSNFGFPKAHAAAFAVLAYQSCWLRKHYPVEFLTALLNAQPMGFYPPASLVRDAQRRGVRTLPPCVNRSLAICKVDDNAMRVGLGYVREVRQEAAERVVAERDVDGPFRDLADLASRTDLRTEQLTQLVRAGACDVFERPRREMMWELGTLARPREEKKGRQLALSLEPSPAPSLPELSRFERTVTDYETMGLSAGWHLIALLRPSLPRETIRAEQLRELPDGTEVCLAGLLVARQRPATAKGIVFILLEDETGLANGVVMPQIYERYRSLVRGEPLVIARGTLERRDRNLNVMVSSLEKIQVPDRVPDDAMVPADELHRLRAAVPPGQYFGRGGPR
ncbi:MAG: error-prone DNA polymerase, partial [Thermoleophilia bacterium]|nr:error-prone DNA polymerase [Thermoleophilia bacterium]